MSQHPHTSSACAIERLEGRTLLSGNVTALMVDGNLAIEGDNVANDIIVDQVGLTTGQVRITSGANATAINGQANPVILEGLTGDVFASLHLGPDRLALHDLVIPGNLTVQTGLGADAVTLFTVTVDGNTSIRTGVRADSIELDDSIFTGSLFINMRWGADTLRIEQNGDAEGVRSFFHGPVDIMLSRGDDDLRIGLDANAGNRAVFYSSANFNGGLGNDELRNGDGNWFDVTPSVVDFEYSEIVPPLA